MKQDKERVMEDAGGRYDLEIALQK